MDSKKFSQKEIDAALEDHLKKVILARHFLQRDVDKIEDFISGISDLTEAFANTMMVEEEGQVINPESDLPSQIPKHVIEMAFKFQFIVNPDDALKMAYQYLSLYVPDEKYEKALLDKPKHLRQLEQKGKTGDEADRMATMLAVYPLALDKDTGKPKKLGDIDKDTEQFVASITHGEYNAGNIERVFIDDSQRAKKKYTPPRP